MKILIINDFLLLGGAEQSCLKMKKLLEEHKNDVYYLTFDSKFKEKIEIIDNKKNIININVNNKINKLIFNLNLYFKIRKVLKNIKPDKIILNNIFCSPITQLKALKGYDAIQIIRDYTVVCPKSTNIKEDYSICKGYKYEKCIKNCKYHNSKIQLLLKLKLIRKIEKLRKKYVKKCIAPSQALTDYLLNYEYDAYCINNPMDINVNNEFKKSFNIDKKNYLYVGMINENKGIYKFLDAYNEFSKDRNVKLKIVGKCTSNEDKEKLHKYLSDNEKIEFLGYKEHKETIEEIQKSDYIIIPSLWIENYPTTALEGMLYRSVVLGSDRGGIPEIIGRDKGIMFNILQYDDILKVLKESYDMQEEVYKKFQDRAYEYVINNNSFDKYYREIMQVLNN